MEGEKGTLIVQSVNSAVTSLGRGKTSLVAWLLCFPGFQVEPQFLSLGFYFHATT